MITNYINSLYANLPLISKEGDLSNSMSKQEITTAIVKDLASKELDNKEASQSQCEAIEVAA